MSVEAAMPVVLRPSGLDSVVRLDAGEVRVARTLEEVEQLREARAALPSPDLEGDIDFFTTLARQRDDILRPHVLVLERDGEVRAMAMARLEARRAAARVGARVVAAPRLRCLTVVHGGTASVDDDAEAALVDALWRAVRAGEADAVFLHKVRVDSRLHRAATARWPRALRPTPPPAGGHWRLSLPDRYETYLEGLSSRTRASVRKQARRLEGDFGDGLVVRHYREEAELPALLADIEAIASRSYQRGLGGGFRDDPEQRALLELGLRRGWVRAWVLHLDGRPCAYEIGHLFGDTFYGSATGFDPEFGQLRPGTYVQMRMVEDLCADPTAAAIDFGYGDADYKRSFANERWEDADVTLLGPRPRALAAGAILGAAATADRAARRVLGEGRVMTYLRRRRRERARAA